MDTEIGIKLDMGERALGFSTAHPSDNPGLTKAVSQLGEKMTRAQTLILQERTGRVVVKAAVGGGKTARQQIIANLNLLAGIADAASADDPDLAARLKLPRPTSKTKNLLAVARVAVTQATPRKELLIANGMPATLLEEITAAADQYEATRSDKNTGRTTHVGAHADLEKVTSEIMALVKQIDRLNRYRFRNDAELLAAWKSARDVAWPAGEKKAPNAQKKGGTAA